MSKKIAEIKAARAPIRLSPDARVLAFLKEHPADAFTYGEILAAAGFVPEPKSEAQFFGLLVGLGFVAAINAEALSLPFRALDIVLEKLVADGTVETGVSDGVAHYWLVSAPTPRRRRTSHRAAHEPQ